MRRASSARFSQEIGRYIMCPTRRKGTDVETGSAANSVPDQHRFEATRISNTRQNVSAFGLMMVMMLLFAASLMAPAKGVHLPSYVIPVLFVGIFVAMFLAYRRVMAKKVVISVTSGGLSIDQRPGDVFPF